MTLILILVMASAFPFMVPDMVLETFTTINTKGVMPVPPTPEDLVATYMLIQLVVDEPAKTLTIQAAHGIRVTAEQFLKIIQRVKQTVTM